MLESQALDPSIDHQPRNILAHQRARLHRRNEPLDPTRIPKAFSQLDILKRVPWIFIRIAMPHFPVDPCGITVTDNAVLGLDPKKARKEFATRRSRREYLVCVFERASAGVHDVLEQADAVEAYWEGARLAGVW
jgi:hypothetical protein